jgi:hypothetical protein
MRNKGGRKVANDRYWSWTVVKDILFSFYLAAILEKLYFLFRSLQPNNKSSICRLGLVLLT